MKGLGIIIVFLGCASLGFIIDSYQAKRIRELEALVYAFEMLKGEIDYQLTPLPEACLHIAELSMPSVKSLFATFSENLMQKVSSDTSVLWDMTVKNEKHKFSLSEEDWSTLCEFSQTAGALDKEMQKHSIDRLLLKIKYTLDAAREKYTRTSKLNKNMGILIGACISIVLI